MTEKCKTCEYWSVHSNGISGDCRRYAPGRKDLTKDAMGIRHFPKTKDGDWCGDHSSGNNLSEEHSRDSSASDAALAIVQEVCVNHGVSVEEVFGKSRIRRISMARQEAMRAVQSELGYSHAKIGKIFRRDDSTVFHAIHNAAKPERRAK